MESTKTDPAMAGLLFKGDFWLNIRFVTSQKYKNFENKNCSMGMI